MHNDHSFIVPSVPRNAAFAPSRCGSLYNPNRQSDDELMEHQDETEYARY